MYCADSCKVDFRSKETLRALEDVRKHSQRFYYEKSTEEEHLSRFWAEPKDLGTLKPNMPGEQFVIC